MPLTEKVIRNFWKKVDKNGPVPTHCPELGQCWLWNRRPRNCRYGNVWDGEKLTGAHKLSFRINFGEIPKGKDICHACDNGFCVRPEHLWSGTKSENVRDSISKGRFCLPSGQIGEGQWNHKLTRGQVSEIFKLKASGKFTQKEIGKQFNVGQDQISRILNKKRWRRTMSEIA